MTISLKTDIQTAFQFKKKELGYDILYLIAKKGPMVKYSIEQHLASGTRKRVNGIIDNFLIPYGYVIGIQSKTNRRNVQNAFGKGIKIKPTKYHLTIKGVIASLSKISLRDNYVIKRYLEFFPNILHIDVNEYVINEIFFYVTYYNIQETNLNTLNDIVFHIDDTGKNWEMLNLDKKIIKKINVLENTQKKILKKFINEESCFLLEKWIKVIKLLTKQKMKKENILKKLEFQTGKLRVDFNSLLKYPQTYEQIFAHRLLDESKEIEKRKLIIKKKREKELKVKS